MLILFKKIYFLGYSIDKKQNEVTGFLQFHIKINQVLVLLLTAMLILK